MVDEKFLPLSFLKVLVLVFLPELSSQPNLDMKSHQWWAMCEKNDSKIWKEDYSEQVITIISVSTYKPVSKAVAVVQKPSCHIIALVPTVTLPRLHPVAGGIVSLQPHKICYSLY